ncbi:MAG: hypothetical protein QM767_16180 [Anaeromyxobacter sp.]
MTIAPRRAAPALLALLALTGCPKQDAPPPSDVSGTYAGQVWWTDGTVAAPVAEPVPQGSSMTAFAVVVPSGSGYRVVDGALGADAAFTVPDVPAGPAYVFSTWETDYYLAPDRILRSFTYHLDEVADRTAPVELGGRALGRYHATGESVALDLTGLDPWPAAEAGADDRIAFYAPDARVGEVVAPSPGEGAVEATVYVQRAGGSGSLYLDSARDVIHAWQLHPMAGGACQAAARTGHAAVPVGGGTVPVALDAPPATATAAVDLRASEFWALSPSATPWRLELRVLPDPLAAVDGPLSGVRAALLWCSTRADDLDAGTPSFAVPDGAWGLEREVVATGDVQLDVDPMGPVFPGPWGGTLFYQREPASTPGPIRPLIGPPRDLRINGKPLDFTAHAGVGETPLLTWDPPAVGTPTSYLVRLDFGYFTARTVRPELRLPPGVLQLATDDPTGGQGNWVEVTAVYDADATPTAPYREGRTHAEATALGSSFTR